VVTEKQVLIFALPCILATLLEFSQSRRFFCPLFQPQFFRIDHPTSFGFFLRKLSSFFSNQIFFFKAMEVRLRDIKERIHILESLVHLENDQVHIWGLEIISFCLWMKQMYNFKYGTPENEFGFDEFSPKIMTQRESHRMCLFQMMRKASLYCNPRDRNLKKLQRRFFS
jgi:hypothetical protein